MTVLHCRSRKTSITTGIVDRSEAIKQETVDRLSPLTNVGAVFTPTINDPAGEIEKIIDLDMDVSPTILKQPENQDLLFPSYGTGNGGNTRRHTVGPGDVAHEQALANPTAPINFKMGPEAAVPHIPTNLPMLENQPLNLLTMKDQHLLKPPTVMGASTFGRRASDGGANLHIYYPTGPTNMVPTMQDVIYQQHQQVAVGACGDSVKQMQDAVMTGEGGEESGDEIQR